MTALTRRPQRDERSAQGRADDDRYVEVRDVSKAFRGRGAAAGRTTHVLENISLAIGRHELISLIGPSGSGKTTLLRVLAGLERPGRGDVLIGGKKVTAPSPDLAVVFQQPALLPWASALDNVCLGLRMRGMGKMKSRSLALPLLETVGIRDFASYLPGELSGGMQQRVALARALVLNPSVLLMDEPFAGLDEITRRRLQAELLNLWDRGSRAGLFITHSVDEAILLADRVAIMSPRPGRIYEVYPVALPRPRTLHVEHSPEFLRARAHIWKEIEKWVP